MWNLVLKAALSYIESHPEVLADLIDQAVKAGLKLLKAHNDAPAA